MRVNIGCLSCDEDRLEIGYAGEERFVPGKILAKGGAGLGGGEGLLAWRGCGIFGGLHDEQAGVGAEGDTAGFEGEDDAAAELAQDAVFLVGADAEVDGVNDGAAVDFIDAEDCGVGDDDVLEGGVLADGGGDFAEESDDLIRVGAGVYRDGERGDGVVAGEVGDGSDLGVGDDVEGSVAVTDAGKAQGEVFDRALEAGYFDHVADVVLVFHEDEDAVDDVLEEGLGGEADADADDAGGGEQGAVVNGEKGKDLQEDQEPNDTEGSSADDGGDGAELGGALSVVRDLLLREALKAMAEDERTAGEEEEEDEDDEEFGEAFDDCDEICVPVALDDVDGGLV
jgi:hypothetical protein